MTDDRRTVAVVTGTRAEYGLLRSSMEAIDESDGLELQVVATGMHLSPRYGSTVDEIRADGFDVAATTQMLVEGDSGAGMAKSLGVGVLGFTDTLQSLDPDIVLVLGDRDEPLAAGLAAAHMNVPLAHIHGGDAAKGATIDESIRHALTKFAHLHFPVTERSAERIRRLGEEPWRIDVVGAPGLDDVLAGRYATPTELAEEYGIAPDEPTIVVLQHPLTKAPERAGEQMHETLDAVAAFDAQTVCIYPNADAGREAMVAAIESRADELGLHTFRNLPRRHFLALLETADVLVGNSSSGLIEAPSFGLPVVDVGPRQAERERADNTIDAEHDAEAIEAAIRSALSDPEIRRRAATADNPYEQGGAGIRIAERLETVSLDDRLVSKSLTY
jgi:UDP-N-acetylglucosamine 2-epimerase (non-hydrolysing)/GDP/UDP-N,N'-diacetylbacillosamine 2-epimerase (hydrolysing)